MLFHSFHASSFTLELQKALPRSIWIWIMKALHWLLWHVRKKRIVAVPFGRLVDAISVVNPHQTHQTPRHTTKKKTHLTWSTSQRSGPWTTFPNPTGQFFGAPYKSPKRPTKAWAAFRAASSLRSWSKIAKTHALFGGLSWCQLTSSTRLWALNTPRKKSVPCNLYSY